MHALYLLWWVQEKQISPAVVAAILAAGDLTLLAIELPTGWFADRVGHRASLVIGSLVQVFGMLWCWLGEGIVGIATASVLIALGDAFRSGADEALLYRSCLAVGREEEFQRIEARTRAIETASLVVLVLIGGAIVTTWGFAAGWLAETLLCSIGLGLACALSEPPRSVDPGSSDSRPIRANFVTFRLAGLIVPAALLGGMAGVASFLAQTTETADPFSVTLLVAAIALAEAGGSAVATRVTTGGLRHQLALAAAGVVLFTIGLAHSPAAAVVVPALSFLDGVAHPLRATLIQRVASDGVRARMASLASACDMAVSTVALPLAGLARRRR
jgi:MFS family permease